MFQKLFFYSLLFHLYLLLSPFQSLAAPTEDFTFRKKTTSFFHLQYFPSHASPYFYALLQGV